MRYILPALGVFMCTLAASGRSVSAQLLPSNPVQLLASQSTLGTVVTLTPTDPSTVETLTGPTIFDLTVPRDRNRSHLTLNFSQSFNWHQIPNGVPYQFSGGLRLFVSSDVL